MPGAHILIPCKPLGHGKSRLAGILPAASRFALCAFLLETTLTRALTLAGPGRVHVLTADSAAATIASRFGAATIDDVAGDLNGALDLGRDFVLRRTSGDSLIVLPIDLPFATENALRKMATSYDITLAGDEGLTGTNLLALKGKAARDFQFGFGAGSFARHRDRARREGYSVAIVSDPALAFDLDDAAGFRRSGLAGQFKTAALAS